MDDEDDLDFDDLMDMLDDDAPLGDDEDEEDDDDDLSDLEEPEELEEVDVEIVVKGGVKVMTTGEPAPETTTLARDRPRERGAAQIAVAATPDSEAIRRVLISGHCAFPQSRNPDKSHLRCAKNGAGSRANPDKIFQPCPCPCHFPVDRYECDSCGGTLAAAPHWPVDEDGDMRYVHVNTKTGRIIGTECLS
jgi:hypothetical protein